MKVNHAPPSSYIIRNVCSSTSNPPYAFMVRSLIRHKDNKQALQYDLKGGEI